jgi:3-isopropylmalate/(R)-2-methylmalate dehydratase large subunit
MTSGTRTMLDKIWEDHVVRRAPGEPDIMYVDLHLVHEVTSPQAFAALRAAGRKVRRPDLTLATTDHSVPTRNRDARISDPDCRRQVDTLVANCREAGIMLFDMSDTRQGVIHVIAPEQGVVQPGMTVICGDSHTATHGALGALAMGIGTSEVEHVLATQTLRQGKPKAMSIRAEGSLGKGVTAKDLILGIIAQIGVRAGTGHAIEYRGEAFRALSMEGRMTVCNMSIEAGARAGMIAPDDTTFAYLEGRPFAPVGALWEEALAYWRTLPSDPAARFEAEVVIDASALQPYVTWGTNPAQAVPIGAAVPSPDDFEDSLDREAAASALEYMALKPGTPMTSVAIDKVFIGSCTNGRIDDLRAAAAVVAGYRVDPRVTAIVVPGSGLVKAQAEAEGLDRIFTDAGFEWRHAGCSMCIAMNGDDMEPGQRSASTSNRNFQGRQGPGSRTHLVSPAMAAAAAVTGHLVDVRGWRD